MLLTAAAVYISEDIAADAFSVTSSVRLCARLSTPLLLRFLHSIYSIMILSPARVISLFLLSAVWQSHPLYLWCDLGVHQLRWKGKRRPSPSIRLCSWQEPLQCRLVQLSFTPLDERSALDIIFHSSTLLCSSLTSYYFNWLHHIAVNQTAPNIVQQPYTQSTLKWSI